MGVQDSGNLNQRAFLALLVELHQKSATGSLKLERAPLQKAVYLRDGQILFAASNDPQDQLASILVDEGKLSKDQMQVAQARVSAGNPLAKVLTELGYISQRELADAARLKVEKILTDLYGWKEGTFQFVERSLPKGAIDLELSTPRLIFNSVQRIEDREWILEQLGSLDSVLSATPLLEGFLAKASPDPSAGDVLRLVDGVQSIKQIGALSTLGEFEVCKILTAALLTGALEKSSAGTPFAKEPASPAAPPPSEASFPFPADAGETTALNIGGGESNSAEAGYTDPPAVPLAEIERASAPPASQPSGNFVFDEPPSTDSPEQKRMPPRPRKMNRGGGLKKALTAAAALLAIGGVAGAAYYFFWGQEESSAGTNGSPPVTTQAGQTPKPPPTATKKPPTSTTAPPTTTPPPSGPTPTSPSTTRPPRPTTGPPPTATPSQPTQKRPAGNKTKTPPKTASSTKTPSPPPRTRTTTTTAPPRTSPSSNPKPTSTGSRPGTSSGQSLAQGQQQLKSGNYPQAAATFLGHLRKVGPDKFTIAVGVFCDASNVNRVVQNSGGSEQLLVLSFDNKGRSCYRVFWGIFNSRAEAQRAIASVPASVRARDSAPVAIARLIS